MNFKTISLIAAVLLQPVLGASTINTASAGPTGGKLNPVMERLRPLGFQDVRTRRGSAEVTVRRERGFGTTKLRNRPSLKQKIVW